MMGIEEIAQEADLKKVAGRHLEVGGLGRPQVLARWMKMSNYGN